MIVIIKDPTLSLLLNEVVSNISEKHVAILRSHYPHLDVSDEYCKKLLSFLIQCRIQGWKPMAVKIKHRKTVITFQRGKLVYDQEFTQNELAISS
jgi:hypothetical protein